MKIFRLIILCTCLGTCSTKPEFNYPITRTEPFDTTIFDMKIADPYFWMERKTNQTEMKEWVNAQGKLTQSILDSIPNGDSLLAEIDNTFIKMQDEIWDLEVINNQFYYSRDGTELLPFFNTYLKFESTKTKRN